MSSMLDVRGIDVYYGDVQAVRGVSFFVVKGEIVTLIGANGAGKSTILKTLAGLLHPRAGSIGFDGADASAEAPFRLVERGLVLVPEARQLWPAMTVLENLEMGAYSKSARSHRRATLEKVLALFPILEKRASQDAGTLSGGEQQMCAIGRGLMARPRLLVLDEPALGLAPILVREVFAALKAIRELGVTVLLVEQNVARALALSQRGYVLENGGVALSGSREELLASAHVRRAYLGV